MNFIHIDKLRKLSFAWPSFIFITSLIITQLLDLLGIPVIKILRGAEHYGQFSENASIIIYKCIFFILSLMSSLSVLSIVRWSNNYTAAEGKRSIYYYLFHGLVIEFVLLPCFIGMRSELGLFEGLIASIICVVICSYMSKINIFIKLVGPYNYLNKLI